MADLRLYDKHTVYSAPTESACYPQEEVVAAKPTAQHDAAWGKGFLTPEQYVAFVYNTL